MDSDDDEVLYPFDPLVRSCEGTRETRSEIRARIMEDDVEYLKAYIERGEEINCSDNLGDTALHVAVLTKSVKCIKYLLGIEYVRKEIKNFLGETPLLYSLRKEVPDEIILELIAHGCDINAVNLEESTALHAAVRRQTPNVSVALIEKGANVDAKDANGYTPLHEAVFAEKFENICMLLYYNASVNEPAKYSDATPFMMAIRQTNRKICELLIDFVDDINGVDAMNLHPLSIALRYNFDFYKEIIAYGGDVNHFDRNPCIFGTLEAPTSETFKVMWSVVNHKTLLGTMFLHQVFYQFVDVARGMPDEHKLEILALVFDCKYIRSLIDEYLGNNTNNNSSGMCIKMLYERVLKNFDVNTRVEFLYLFLSRGLPVHFGDVLIMHTYFGFSEDLEVILSTEVEVRKAPETIFGEKMLIYRIMYDDPTFLDEMRAPDDIYNGFYRSEKLVPTLLQLSRDACRRSIYKSQQVSPNFKVARAIRRLNIPRLLKDVLILKWPLYRDNDDDRF